MKAPHTGNNFFDLLVRSYNAARGILGADRIILNNINRPSDDSRVNLHFWESSNEINHSIANNLGDDLSPIIVENMLNLRGFSLNDNVRKKRHLYAIGSIVSMGYQDATIWGSGFLEDLSFIRQVFHHYPIRKLDIRAVRGPLTRQLLIKLGHKCPEVYGDPALLLPLFYKPSCTNKEYDYIIIPHFSMESYYKSSAYRDNIVSMITKDYQEVINRICSSRFVISGSLHGIILAESYGVPALFLRDRGKNKDFKYYDYYYSTNREGFMSASSIAEALRKGPMDLPDNIQSLQNGLLESFPYDLWI